MLSDLISTFTRLVPYRFEGVIEACELCGGTEHEVVGTRSRNGEGLRTVLCRGCGLVFTNPMPTQDEIDNYYRHHYREHYQGTSVPRKKSIVKNTKGARMRLDMLASLLKPDATVVDVGSGGGEFVREVSRRGFKGIGVEPHIGFAWYSRDTYGVEVHAATWKEAPLADGSIDAVSANHVLEHFRHPLQALRRFHAWLKPDGILYLSVPDIENPRKTPYGRFHFSHLYNFNHASLVMMARRAGFEPHPDLPAQSTTIIFRKVEPSETDWMMFPNNGKVMSEFFRTYTNRRHFFSMTPYRRWVERMWRLGSNMVTARWARL